MPARHTVESFLVSPPTTMIGRPQSEKWRSAPCSAPAFSLRVPIAGRRVFEGQPLAAHARAAPPRDPATDSSVSSQRRAVGCNFFLPRKAKKLIRLWEIEGYKNVHDLVEAAVALDTVCPAICMTAGCEDTAEMDQREGYCESCGGNTMMSAPVLAEAGP